jgi:hypothetical protein
MLAARQELRISFVASVSFVWLVYLSNVSHAGVPTDAQLERPRAQP